MNRRQSGFTLIEVLLAAGIMAAVALSSASLSKVMLSSTLKAKRTQENLGLYYEVLALVSNPSLCKDSFIGAPLVQVTKNGVLQYQEVPLVLAFNAPPATPHASPASVTLAAGVEYNNQKIGRVVLGDIKKIGSYVRGVVLVEGERLGKFDGRKEFATRIPVFLTANATGTAIADCVGGVNDNSSLCDSIGGTWIDSYPATNPPTKICDLCAQMGGLRQANGACLMNQGLNTGFTWQIGNWDSCSSNTQARSVTCLEVSSGDTVAPTKCPAPKPADWQTCSTYQWQVGSWGSCDKGDQSRLVQCIDTDTLAVVDDSKCTQARPNSQQRCMGKWVSGSGTLLGYNYHPDKCNAPNCKYTNSVPTYVDPNNGRVNSCLIPRLSCKYKDACIVGDTRIDQIRIDCVVDETKVTADFLCTCVP